MGWSGIGCDGDHDIFAVALMRTWVSKVSALCRYSASSAVQAVQTVQTVQTGLDLEALTNLMKQIVLYDPRSTNTPAPVEAGLAGAAHVAGRRYLLAPYVHSTAEPAGDLLYMAGLGEEVQHCSRHIAAL